MDKDIGRQAKQEDRKAKKAEEKEKKKTGYILLGENRGNKIQEQTKKRTRSHKGDEEKKSAAKKSNYLVEKNRASGKDGFAPLLLRAPNSQTGRQIFRKFLNS